MEAVTIAAGHGTIALQRKRVARAYLSFLERVGALPSSDEQVLENLAGAG